MPTYLKNAKILSEKGNAFCIEEHDILIRNHKIAAFDVFEHGTEIIDLKGKLLIPQFFNIHSHLGESLYSIEGNCWNIGKYLDYTSGITNSKTDSENEKIWSESADKSIKLMQEAACCGFCAARSALKAKAADMLSMSGYPLMLSDKLKKFYVSGIDGFLKHCSLFRTAECSAGVFLHSVYKSNQELLKLAGECMQNNAEFISVHISEDAETRQMEERLFKKEPVFVLNECGLLRDASILVHGSLLSEQELNLVAAKKAAIAICPVSSRFLNSHTANPHKLNKKGIKWCIGSDGLATGRTFSLIEQIKVFKKEFPEISNVQLLKSVTQVPASLFKRAVYTGLVETGVKASFITINFDNSGDMEQSLGNFLLGNTEYDTLSL